MNHHPAVSFVAAYRIYVPDEFFHALVDGRSAQVKAVPIPPIASASASQVHGQNVEIAHDIFGFAGRTQFYIVLDENIDVGAQDWKKAICERDHEIVETALNAVPERKEKIAVITGGEPLMHDLTALTQLLQQKGFKTHIETSGAHPLTGTWDWICLSPKKFKAPLSDILPLANELKVVVFNKTDFEWAESFASQLHPDCKLYLQPEWDKKELVMPLIIDYIQQHPQWRLSLQIHKYIGVP